jgi:hypothetical protein
MVDHPGYASILALTEECIAHAVDAGPIFRKRHTVLHDVGNIDLKHLFRSEAHGNLDFAGWKCYVTNMNEP